eukprot:TRINITY_DN1754_c0_g1_i1.p1 TRINITY_DN1754_c0_g1~~TRINITY_DN1754_c0_g1_i1.p1  ORF type:complete len:1019 (+),score=98.78 TRINITY_DN1754_c0_g1_i1:187-3057(+)
MEKRSSGSTRSGSLADDDVSAKTLHSPRVRKRSESGLPWVKSALWKPLAATISIYVTVSALVWEIWCRRVAMHNHTLVVQKSAPRAEIAKAIATTKHVVATALPRVNAPRQPAPSSFSTVSPPISPMAQTGHPMRITGNHLEASWVQGSSASDGKQQGLAVNSLLPETMRVRGVDLGPLELFELVFQNGNRVCARECHVQAIGPVSGDSAVPRANAQPTAVVDMIDKPVTLRCPLDIEVSWSATLVRVLNGAEVLRIRLSFMGASARGSDAASQVERLVLWSLGVTACDDVAHVTSNANTASKAAPSGTGASIAPPHGERQASPAEPTQRPTACFAIDADGSTAASVTSPFGRTDGGGFVAGSPLVSTNVGAWLAVEHPRATFAFRDSRLEFFLDSPDPQSSYTASLGVTGAAAVMRTGTQAQDGTTPTSFDAFQALRRHFNSYLDVIRPSPYLPNLHYSTWYDLRRAPCVDSSELGYSACSSAHRLTRAMLEDRLMTIHRELFILRGVPLDGLLIDDGWDDSANAPWEADPENFQGGGLTSLGAQAAALGVSLGAWMSPWGGFRQGGHRRLRYISARGLDIDVTSPAAIDGVSNSSKSSGSAGHLSGRRYYAWFRNATRELVLRAGLRFLKMDGFGKGLGAIGAQGKLARDVDALLRLVAELRQDTGANKEIASWRAASASRRPLWVAASTGAWPSPFWLLTADAVWRDGPDLGREGTGSIRQQWITFRDRMVYENVVLRAPFFPLASLMLGGIVWSRAEEPGAYLNSFDLEDFCTEVRSFFLTGAALQDLQVQPELLTPTHWDIIADAVNVSRQHATVLKDSHWFGGNPAAGEVYAYGAFACPPCLGLLSWRNPQAAELNKTFTLRQALSLPKQWPGGSPNGLWQVQQLWHVESVLNSKTTPRSFDNFHAASSGRKERTIVLWEDIRLDDSLMLPFKGFEHRALRISPAAVQQV